MLKYKHILVALDLSDYTDKVMEAAKNMAEAPKAKISLVHVIEGASLALGGEIMMPIDIDFEQSIETHTREKLEKLAEKNGIAKNNVYLEMGSVKHAVNELAARIAADLIIVGTHGHHGIERLMGSRANGILHLAKIDVLSIRVAD